MSKLTSILSSGRPSARSNKAATLAILILAGKIGTKRVNFELPDSEHTKLKIYAAKQGKTSKEMLTIMLSAYAPFSG